MWLQEHVNVLQYVYVPQSGTVQCDSPGHIRDCSGGANHFEQAFLLGSYMYGGWLCTTSLQVVSDCQWNVLL